VSLRFFPDDTKIDFISQKKIAFGLSILLLIGSIYLIISKGFNFGIDFTGGILIEAQSDVELSVIRKTLSKENFGEISLQNFGEHNDIIIRIQGSENQEQVIEQVKRVLTEKVDNTIVFRKTDFVGPQVGGELIKSGAIALISAFVMMMLYIWIRFEWQFGLGAIIALIHDSILTMGFFSLTWLEFNLTSIAAILTIVGYSINDSVVIYDRVREDLRKFKKKPIEEILNISINETLSRTILTAGTTICALLSLVFFGGEVLQSFSLAVLFGVTIGTYSSIYVASPILTVISVNEESL